jgi:methylenetetrahydrofolate reductase (NADPH)
MQIKGLGIEGAAHMTCVRDTRDEIAALLDMMVARGIENVVALRGDIPPDPAFRRPSDGFTYATDLAAFIRARGYPLCVIGAGHPEGHPETRDLDQSIRHLKAKVDAGIDVVITQLFYDNRDYFAFVDRARRAGITVPLVAGIMPITNWPQIERITRLSGNQVPTVLRERLERVRDDEDGAMQVGIDWAIAQCTDLLRQGAPGIHFYTLNKSPATRAIFESLRAAGLVA